MAEDYLARITTRIIAVGRTFMGAPSNAIVLVGSRGQASTLSTLSGTHGIGRQSIMPLEEVMTSIGYGSLVLDTIGQSNWPVELDLEGVVLPPTQRQ